MKFLDSYMFDGTGSGAHMLEDALVFNPGYKFLWPVSGQKRGIGIVHRPNWYGVVNPEGDDFSYNCDYCVRSVCRCVRKMKV